jgi:hypothetical protein
MTCDRREDERHLLVHFAGKSELHKTSVFGEAFLDIRHGMGPLTQLLMCPVHRLSSTVRPPHRTETFLHRQRRDLQQATNPRTIHRTIPWSRG